MVFKHFRQKRDNNLEKREDLNLSVPSCVIDSIVKSIYYSTPFLVILSFLGPSTRRSTEFLPFLVAMPFRWIDMPPM